MSGYTLRGGPVVSLEDRVTARATRRKQSASAALPRPAHAETGIDGSAAGAYPTEPPQQSVRGGDQGDNLQPVQADVGEPHGQRRQPPCAEVGSRQGTMPSPARRSVTLKGKAMSASNDNTVKAALLRGVPWTSAARITSEVTAVGALVALARLIPPADFGKAVAAIAIANIGAGLALQSFAMDLVQRTTLASRHTRAAMLLNGLIGGIMTAAVVAVGLVLEPVLGEDASKLVAIVAPVFLLAGLSAVPRALLQRDLKYKELGVVEVVSLV